MINGLKKMTTMFSNKNFLLKVKVIVPYLLAFVLPLILVTSLFRLNGYYPFVKDGQTLLMADMQGQYIAFFRYYKAILDGQHDLIYTLGKVGGGDMLSLIGYYLASPFNLIIKFFSLDELPAALIWIICLKVATTGLSTYITLRALNKHGSLNLVLAIIYSLIAYNFVYYSNIMWLDGVLILPLISLGIIKIIREESYLVYTFSLSYAIMTNWYIGIMLCVFSVFFFLTNLLLESKKRGSILKVTTIFALCSLVAGIISFGFWGTAFINILGTKGGQSFTNIKVTIQEFYDVLSISRGFFFASFQGIRNISGSATSISFYVGALPLILTILLFANPRFKILQKLPIVVLFLIYLLAFYNKGIDHLFHGGPAPTWFPARYAFIFGFLLVYYGSVGVNHLRSLKPFSFIYPLIIFVASLIFVSKLDYEVNGKGLVYFISAYTLTMALYLILHTEELKKLSIYRSFKTIRVVGSHLVVSGLALLSILNVYQNANHILTSFNETLTHPSIAQYHADEKIAVAIDYIQGSDQGLYRIEKSFSRAQSFNRANNDAMYYGYNGLSHYSSNEKKTTMDYLKKIGFLYNSFDLNYETGSSTLAMNAYLGIKYLLDNGQNLNYNIVDRLPLIPGGTFEDIKIYENTYALPLLFPVLKSNSPYINEGIRMGATTYWFNIFEYQNSIFKSMTDAVKDEHGVAKDIFKKAEYTTTLSGVEANENDYSYNVADRGSISYQITLDKATNYYYYLQASDNRDLQLIANGRYHNYFTSGSNHIEGIKHKGPTSTVQVNINASRNDINIRESIYYEDLDVLREYVTAIKEKAEVEITQVKTSKYQATIRTHDNEQMMLMTLPYDEHIQVSLNGKRIEALTRFNNFIGFVIPEAGSHQVEIKYVQLSFQAGLPIGLFIAALTAASPIIINHIKKRNIRSKGDSK